MSLGDDVKAHNIYLQNNAKHNREQYSKCHEWMNLESPTFEIYGAGSMAGTGYSGTCQYGLQLYKYNYIHPNERVYSALLYTT